MPKEIPPIPMTCQLTPSGTFKINSIKAHGKDLSFSFNRTDSLAGDDASNLQAMPLKLKLLEENSAARRAFETYCKTYLKNVDTMESVVDEDKEMVKEKCQQGLDWLSEFPVATKWIVGEKKKEVEKVVKTCIPKKELETFNSLQVW